LVVVGHHVTQQRWLATSVSTLETNWTDTLFWAPRKRTNYE